MKRSKYLGDALQSQGDLNEFDDILRQEKRKVKLQQIRAGGPGSGRYPKGSGGQQNSGAQQTARVFNGTPVATKTKLNRLQTGAIGEQIATAFLKSQGISDAHSINTAQPNFPVDLIGDHQLVEAKAGLVSNTSTAQQWRTTIGEPGPAEQAWLKTASSSDKAAWNQRKQQDIINRKNKVLRDYQKKLGQDVKARTITSIINPDTKTADVFAFDGFHSRIAWNSPEAQAAYKGTYAYTA